MDRFNEDFKKLEGLERMVKDYLKERSQNVKAGQSTAKVRIYKESFCA